MKLVPLIYVLYLQKSANFYTQVLGFGLGEFFPNEENPTYVSVYVGKYKLMLVVARKSNERFRIGGIGGSGFQLFAQIDDVDKKWDEIKNKVEVVDGIETKDWGDREFTIKDPDGYLISFYTPNK